MTPIATEVEKKIYENAADSISNYCACKYCGISHDTTEQQMGDYLLIAQETSLPVTLADDPLSAVAEGTGQYVSHLEEFLKNKRD